MNVIRFKEINSTNTFLKEKYKSLENLTVVVAEHQTMGKGRLGRTWIDNDDLLFSILIKEGIENPTDYSLLIASVLLDVLGNYNPEVKWPNDIMIDEKKVCGILLEAVSLEKTECIVIGVGINVNTTSFPNNLLIKATSLKQIANQDINKDMLLNDIIKRFDIEYGKYLKNESNYLSNITKHFFLKNKEVTFYYQGKKCEGKVKGLSNSGELIVECNGNKIQLISGEVTLESVYNK